MRDLAAAAEAWIVDGREVVLEADAGTDRAGGEQDCFEDTAVVVAARVVGDEEGTAIEEGAATHRTAADEGGGDGGVTELGTCLRPVVTTPEQMTQGTPAAGECTCAERRRGKRRQRSTA